MSAAITRRAALAAIGLGACGALAAALWWCRRNDWLIILALGLAGYAGGLFANLWDALVDPLLALAALAIVINQLTRRNSAGDTTAS